MSESHLPDFSSPEGFSASAAVYEVPSVLPINTMKTLRVLSSEAEQSGRAQVYALHSLAPVLTAPARQVSSSDFRVLKPVLELRPVARLERADRIDGKWPLLEFYRALVRVMR